MLRPGSATVKPTLDFGTAAFGLQAPLTTLSKEDIVGVGRGYRADEAKGLRTGSADYSFTQPLALLRVSQWLAPDVMSECVFSRIFCETNAAQNMQRDYRTETSTLSG